MAFREVGMFEVREVIRLFSEGVPKNVIARVVGVDPKTVRSFEATAEALGLAGVLDDDGLARLLHELRIDVTERPHREAWRRCEKNRDAIEKWLDERVRFIKVRTRLERRKVLVPYPTLHRFAAGELGFGRRRHSVLFVDPPAGAELQVDTGFVWRLGGTRKKAFIFTPTLSRYRFVYVVERETTEAAIEACEAAWAFYGGIFKALVPDNTKAIVDVASSTTPRIVEAFLEYAQARGFAVDPARVPRPQDKDASNAPCSSCATTASAVKTKSSRATMTSDERCVAGPATQRRRRRLRRGALHRAGGVDAHAPRVGVGLAREAIRRCPR